MVLTLTVLYRTQMAMDLNKINLAKLTCICLYVVFMLLPSCKVSVDSFKIAWCFHYHHCLSSELPFVTSHLKIIVEIINPILQTKYIQWLYIHTLTG